MEVVAEIITIGDEILIGQIVDTNSAWIAKELEQIGIKIYQITSVSDNSSHIKKAISESQNRSNIVIITGGLGPTKDDITKQVLCEYFDTKLVFSEETLKNIKKLLLTRGITDINKNNAEQALVPENCLLLENTEGTAPGMCFEKEKTVFFSVPGVPFEMKKIMQTQILPMLKKKYNGKTIIHKVVMTHGIFEAKLSEILEDWEQGLKTKNIKLAYLPQPGIVRLRLSAEGHNKMQIEQDINSEIDKLKDIIPDNIFGYDENSMEKIVGQLLKDKGATISTAESCTGGQIASMITSIPGSSAYFTGSIVAYSNTIKEKILGIDPQTIEKNGAVSKDVVEAMAASVQKLYNTDYAIAVSGIAGPSGGTQQKPVGTTWIAVCSEKNIISKKFMFGDNRQRNIRRTSIMALAMLRNMVI